MRLSKVKLAGFKSFVDPTTIPFMSNLTAVAGPNGCGKSNVIDAVRWVMGESSAKHLRGGSLTDVIFSGSSARKPVGQATVELVFDNAEGKIGGEYASYAEIAIKRQVTRDGQSSYFLNGQRCRRRDITDIFWGTGLGPRSYAIIEQGMISRVIDAKPEDLRVFLEEAAGVSKYKERRRETENRLQHTQENLARLNDLRGELDNQLRHLQKQSQAAERYKALKAEEAILSAQLAALAYQRLEADIQNSERKIRELTNKLEEEQTNVQRLKSEDEKQRVQHHEANEALNEVQKQYYSAGGEIAKIEQAIKHNQERHQQLLENKQEAAAALLAAQNQLAADSTALQTLQATIARLSPEHEQCVEAEKQAIELQQEAEFALEEWRETTLELQQKASAPTRLADAEKIKIAQLEKQIHQTQERMQRLESELSQQPVANTVKCEELLEKKAICEEQLATIEGELAIVHAEKERLTTAMLQMKSQIKVAQQALRDMQAEQAALMALQAASLGKDHQQRNAWIAEQGLDENEYLAKQLSVQSGWEVAVETVLAGFLESITVQDGWLASFHDIASVKEIDICLLERKALSAINPIENRLVNCVSQSQNLPNSIYDLLASVHVSTDFEHASGLLSSLSKGESVITPEGIWLSQDWLRVKAKGNEATDSVLMREERLKRLIEDIAQKEASLDVLQESVNNHEETLQHLEAKKEELRNNKNLVQQDTMALQSEYKIKQNQIEQSQKRIQQIEKELSECKAGNLQAQQEVSSSRGQLHQALEEMAELNQQQEELSQKRAHLQEDAQSKKLKVKEANRLLQEMALKLQTCKTQVLALTENNARCQAQIDNATQRVDNIVIALAKNEEPIPALEEALNTHLEARIKIESELNKARDNLNAIDNLIRDIAQQIQSHDQKMQTIREQLEQAKMQWQALQVRCESTNEKLASTQRSLEDILATVPEEATEVIWQQNIQDIEQKIHRLGAINLAAIEEYEAQLQRKEYLDTQCNDLTEALTTLENAIKKIDKETRAKFKETFDRVNEEFMKLFPRLFGGGQAILQMTGEDLLDTGITLTARPPGKKNSSIQLLSGGEKALTAVALVFSIFQLNPAPFCMLDEVDAPLDDSNVGRFCDLVKEMSKTVQFIYVSHNKLAIEMAEQLQGVTMREPGVSRLVTVDIEEATTQAQS